MHCACMYGNVRVMQFLLKLIDDPECEYISRLYPTVDMCTNQGRSHMREHTHTVADVRVLLTDFYLNTPDKSGLAMCT
jgi:hypothetical protein